MKANILNTLRSLHNDESGQDLIEYALIAAILALGCTATMTTLATAIKGRFVAIGTALGAALPG